LIDASVDVGVVGVAGRGDDMMGIIVGVVVAAVGVEMKEGGIGGNGETEHEFGSGIRVGSEAVVVPIEVRKVEDERLERLERESRAENKWAVEGDDISSLTCVF
jgi:hypothetical protein